MKFRKLPITIDAIQWQPDEALGTFDALGHYINRRVGTDSHGVEYTICDICIRTLEGPMSINPGDWIVTGVKGERYAVRQDIFEMTYEPV